MDYGKMWNDLKNVLILKHNQQALETMIHLESGKGPSDFEVKASDTPPNIALWDAVQAKRSS